MCEGTASSPLGYDGQYTNSDTGLQYLRARNYDPATAQFMSSDPWKAVTKAPYSYAADDPTNLDDPAGLWFGIPGTPSWAEVGENLVENAGPATADFAAGFANAIVSTATFGQVTVGAPFCGRGLGWSYGIGQLDAGLEAGVVTGAAGEALLAGTAIGPVGTPIISGQIGGLFATGVGNAGHASVPQLIFGTFAGGTVGGLSGNVAGSLVYAPNRAAAEGFGSILGSSVVQPPSMGSGGSGCGC